MKQRNNELKMQWNSLTQSKYNIGLSKSVILFCKLLLISAFGVAQNSQAQDTIISRERTIISGKILNGKRVGKWVYQDKNGLLEKVVQFKDNERNAVVEQYCGDDEHLCVRYECRYFQDYFRLEYNGFYQKFMNGFVFIESHYVNGKKHGVNTEYYPNSIQPKTSSVYRSGKKDGDFSAFYKNGVRKASGQYSNGGKKGIWKEFYENGKLKSKGRYLPRLDTIGEEKLYRDSIHVLLKARGIDFPRHKIPEYTHTITVFAKHGKWRYFDMEGNLEKLEIYRDGALLKEEEY